MRPRFGSSILQVCLVLADPTTRVQTAHPSGLVAQLVEHPLCKRGASGSNPDESMGLALDHQSQEREPTWTSQESPPICNPPGKGGLWERLGGPEDTGQVRPAPRAGPAADNGGQNPLTLHTQPGLSRKPKSIESTSSTSVMLLQTRWGIARFWSR